MWTGFEYIFYIFIALIVSWCSSKSNQFIFTNSLRLHNQYTFCRGICNLLERSDIRKVKKKSSYQPEQSELSSNKYKHRSIWQTASTGG